MSQFVSGRLRRFAACSALTLIVAGSAAGPAFAGNKFSASVVSNNPPAAIVAVGN